MRHLKKGRKFGRVRSQRKSLLRSLEHALITHGRIRTTEAKAKELRPRIEKHVSVARAGTLASERLLRSELPNASVRKLVTIAERMKNRNGGYTRIVKLAPRVSDAADQALIEFVN